MENNIKVTRESRGNTLIHRGLSSQQGLFHKAKKDADAAVEASYVVNRLMAIHLRAVSGGLHVARHCFSMSRTEDLVQQYHSISKHSGIAI